ncbi:MAG: VTT domain-containing protein [Candidatus Hydrothermarchaeota archaeon]|nr:VTT domain-containing protein [Candidatus Hydrothermarchaeota archaeon]
MLAIADMMREYPLLALILFIVLDTAFGVVPIELSIVYGISIELSALSIAVLGMVFVTLGALIDYFIGYLGLKIVHVKESEAERGELFFKKYGSWSLFLIRLIPFFPSKPVSVIAGGMRYSVALFSWYTALGSFFRFYLEAQIMEKFYDPSKFRTEKVLQNAYEHLTNISNYAITFSLLTAGFLLYYFLVMRRNKV